MFTYKKKAEFVWNFLAIYTQFYIKLIYRIYFCEKVIISLSLYEKKASEMIEITKKGSIFRTVVESTTPSFIDFHVRIKWQPWSVVV